MKSARLVGDLDFVILKGINMKGINMKILMRFLVGLVIVVQQVTPVQSQKLIRGGDSPIISIASRKLQRRQAPPEDSLDQGNVPQVGQEDSVDEVVVGSGGGETRRSCPIPPPGSPNHFYDGFASCTSMTMEDIDLLNIESSIFRYITAQSDRIRRVDYTTCGEDKKDGGVPYLYDNFAVHGLAMLDLFEHLQLVPSQCIEELHQPLREVFLSQMSVPLEDLTVEIVTSQVQPTPPPIAWWEDTFLPTLANAFSCGFSEEYDTTEDPNLLSSDIREKFLEGDKTIQQVWRLMKGYLRSPQKQRETLNRQSDFDVSLYIPFLKVPMAVKYRDGGVMRGGFPAYQGPSIWFIWHTIAARTAELERECGTNSDVIATKIIKTFGTLVPFFGTTHPCPYCRWHFMTRVSRNDQNWLEFGLEN